MSVTISLSALVCMACLFTPKVSCFAAASKKFLLLCWLNFFKFNIVGRLNDLFDGRCGVGKFRLNAFNVFLAVHYSGATRAERPSKHDDSQPLQRTRQAPGRRIHFDDVNGDGNRHDVQSEGENPATHVNRRGEGFSVLRWHLTCCFSAFLAS